MTTPESIAHQLFEAWQSNTPMEMSAFDGALTDFDAAYQVQNAFAAKKAEPTAGYKISLTSKTTQDLFKTNEPLYGAQIASHILTSPATIDLAQMNEPLIEVELAMTAKEDLVPGLSDEELLARVTVAGDMEVPDARFKAWFPKLDKYLVVADCAVGGYIVCGEPVDGATLSVKDLEGIHVELTLNGQPVRSGNSTEVLGNPINALQWLIQKLAQHGKTLKKGTTVSTGTFFVPPKLEAGLYEATFTGTLAQTVRLTVKGR